MNQLRKENWEIISNRRMLIKRVQEFYQELQESKADPACAPLEMT